MKNLLIFVLCLAPAARAGDITADAGFGLSALQWKNTPPAIAGDTGVTSLSLRGDIRTLRWNLGIELAYGGFDYGVGQTIGSFDIFLNKEGPVAIYLGASLASLNEFNDHGDSGYSFAGGGQAGVLFNRTGMVLIALEARWLKPLASYGNTAAYPPFTILSFGVRVLFGAPLDGKRPIP
jgi:hypothetical protein